MILISRNFSVARGSCKLLSSTTEPFEKPQRIGCNRIPTRGNAANYVFTEQGDTIISTMKDKIQTGSDAFKGLLKTGAEVADKVLDKGTDVATAMMNNMTGLISKLADDIGVMADRILATEEKIGEMADRIVKTEELMAKLTATLANKNLDLSPDSAVERYAVQTALLHTAATEASAQSGPKLSISGDPQSYLLYLSSNPLFREGSTVVTRIENPSDYDTAWRRSINALSGMRSDAPSKQKNTMVVAVAVKTLTDEARLSALSNSIDVTVSM